MKAAALTILMFSLSWASGTLSGHPGGTGGGFIFPETDYILDTYAYNQAEQMSSVGASFTDYATIDDFDPSVDVDVTLASYICWGVTTGSVPTAIELMCVADASGVPSGAPVSQVSYPISCGDTGFTFGSYPIWVGTIDLSTNPTVTTPCWLGSHRNDGVNWYPVGGTTVSGSEGYRTLNAGWDWMAFSDPASGLEPGDLFKVVYSPGWPAVSRNTWAGVKASMGGFVQ